MPPNIEFARAHGKSLRVRFPKKDEQYLQVYTTGYSSERTKIPFKVDNEKLNYFGEFIPLYFYLLKSMIVILVVLFLFTGVFVWVTKWAGVTCEALGIQNSKYFDCQSSESESVKDGWFWIYLITRLLFVCSVFLLTILYKRVKYKLLL